MRLIQLVLISCFLLPAQASATAFYGVCQRAMDSNRIDDPVEKTDRAEYRFYFCSCLQMSAMNSWGMRTATSQLHASQWLSTHHGSTGKASCKSYALNKMGLPQPKKNHSRQWLSMAE